MKELEEIMEDLIRINKNSNKIKNLDNLIDELVLKNKRTYLHKKIEDLSRSIIEMGLKEAHRNFTEEKSIIVTSMYMIMPGKPMRRGHFSTAMTDTVVVETIKGLGEEALEWGDGPDRRLTYLSEFEQRVEILLKGILEGKLDDQFGQPPYEIIHEILGQHGALLLRLGIDPKQGMTYRKFEDLIKQHSKKDKYYHQIN